MTPENEEAARELNSETASVRPAGDGRSLLLDLGAPGERGDAPAVPSATAGRNARLGDEMTQPDELPTETADLVARLNKLVHCIGQKCNPIKKEAARTITRQVERIAELEEAHKAALDLAWKRDGQLVAATARIAELERALADETEACAKLAEAFSPAALIVHDIRIGIYPKQSMPGVAIAAAIRARAALASVQSSTTGASDE